MTVVERPGKSDPGGDQARHLLTRLISTPGSSDTERRKGDLSVSKVEYITRLSPAALPRPGHVAVLDKSNQTAEKKSKISCLCG
jgi:hypothetical protein